MIRTTATALVALAAATMLGAEAAAKISQSDLRDYP